MLAAAFVGDVALVAAMLLAVVAAVAVLSSLALAPFVSTLLSHDCLLRVDLTKFYATNGCYPRATYP